MRGAGESGVVLQPLAPAMLGFPGTPPAKAWPMPSGRRHRPWEDELSGATETAVSVILSENKPAGQQAPACS